MGKLKRFLLRYDPPGIGLEIEEGEEVSVRHKDLPANADVASAKEIGVLVDNLIAEEELLTKRRHRPALLQLLGRLYQIEVDPNEEEAPESSTTSPTAATAPPPDGSPQEGQTVVLVGLKGKQQTFNGELGTLSKVKKDKFEVVVGGGRGAAADGEPLKVKGAEHVVPVAPKGTHLAVGRSVAIRGLRNHVELNGCLARVVECHEETHRFEVRAMDSGQLFRVKQENLIPIELHGASAAISAAKENWEPNANATPRKKEGGAATDPAPTSGVPATGDGLDEILEPGSQVQLVGLKTAMCYNGQTAEVLSVDRVRSRYEIRLNDGSVKTIRSENVRLVAGPSKASPRTRHKGQGGAAQANKMR